MKNKLTVIAAIVLIGLTSALRSQDLWRQLSGPYGGQIFKVVSSSTGKLYAISASGVFKSTNEGLQWISVTPPSIVNITAGDVAPNGYIYLATGNFTSKIFRSTDEGATWQERLPDGGYDFNDMTVTSGGVILAGTSYMFSFHGQFIQSGDIYRSVDNGASFTLSSFPDLAVLALKSNTNGDIYTATLNGLFKSVNSGASWSLIRTDTCTSVYTSPAGHIFLLARQVVYRSTNHGGSWEVVSPRLPMASNPSGALFASESGKIFRSTDNGTSWTEIAVISNSPLFNVYSILSSGTKLFSGSDLGVHKSENGGINWSETNNGIRISNIRTIATRGDNIFTGSERYTSRSTDKGVTWTNLTGGLPEVGSYKIIINENGSVFAFINGSGLYRSVNNGDTWSKLTSLPPRANSGLMGYNSSSHLFLASDSTVYKSTNNGDSWIGIGSGLPTNMPGITGLSVDKQNNIYVSIRWGGFNMQDGLFKSTNSGTSWQQVGSEIVSANFKFHPLGDIYSITATQLLRSTNGGTNFNIVSSAPEYAIEMEIGAAGQIFLHYVENEIYGIKRSSDNGATWTDFTQGLGQLLIADFAFEVNNYLLAATQSGLFRTVTSTIGIISHNNGSPSDYALHQNYPNPFNPETRIMFSLPNKEHVTLVVYNQTGQQVAELVNDELNAGTYGYNWSALGFASGVYYYKLQTAGFESVKKMVLIK